MKRVSIAVFLAVLVLNACGPEKLQTGDVDAVDPIPVSQFQATPLVGGVWPAAPQGGNRYYLPHSDQAFRDLFQSRLSLQLSHVQCGCESGSSDAV